MRHSRRELWWLVGVLALLMGDAHALPPGTLVISAEPANPSSETFDQDLKKLSRSSLKKEGKGWHVYFVAFMKKAVGADEVSLVFYAGEGKKRERINVYPIATRADAKILMSDVEVQENAGFKVGTKYQVLLGRLVGGKEEVYAKTLLTLE